MSRKKNKRLVLLCPVCQNNHQISPLITRLEKHTVSCHPIYYRRNRLPQVDWGHTINTESRSKIYTILCKHCKLETTYANETEFLVALTEMEEFINLKPFKEHAPVIPKAPVIQNNLPRIIRPSQKQLVCE